MLFIYWYMSASSTEGICIWQKLQVSLDKKWWCNWGNYDHRNLDNKNINKKTEHITRAMQLIQYHVNYTPMTSYMMILHHSSIGHANYEWVWLSIVSLWAVAGTVVKSKSHKDFLFYSLLRTVQSDSVQQATPLANMSTHEQVYTWRKVYSEKFLPSNFFFSLAFGISKRSWLRTCRVTEYSRRMWYMVLYSIC